MNAEEAKRIASDMEKHGWNTLLRLQGQHWTVKAIEANTGNEVTIRKPEDWEAHKQTQTEAEAVAAGLVQGALL